MTGAESDALPLHMGSGFVFSLRRERFPFASPMYSICQPSSCLFAAARPATGRPDGSPRGGPCMIWASFRGLPARAMLEGLVAACRVPGTQSRLPPPPLPPLSGNFAFSAGARSLAGSRSLRRTAGEGGAAWEPELGGFPMDFCVLRPVVRRGAPGGGPLAQPPPRGSCFAHMQRRRPICGRPGHSPGVGTGLGTKIA